MQESRRDRECGLNRERREFHVASDGEEMPKSRLTRSWRVWKMMGKLLNDCKQERKRV